MTLRVEEYVREDGTVPFKDWFERLDPQAAVKVATAVTRLSLGNMSNVKWFSGRHRHGVDGARRVQSAQAGGPESWPSTVARETVNNMALTRDFKDTVVARVRRDPKFARALLDESATLFLNGEPEAARLLLRDLVNATVGFEALAEMTDKPAKSLHRMLSRSGNPSMDNLAAIFDAVRHRLKVGLKAQTVRAA